MNVSDYVTLYDYNAWANQKMLDSLKPVTTDEFTRTMAGSFASMRDTLVHILGAECIWLARFKEQPSPSLFDSAIFPDVAALGERWLQVEAETNDYIRTLTESDLTKVLHYTNIKGHSYSLPRWQALHHGANHSTYHRGQVVTLLRQLGHPARETDMLYFYLERNKLAASA